MTCSISSKQVTANWHILLKFSITDKTITLKSNIQIMQKNPKRLFEDMEYTGLLKKKIEWKF